MLESFLDYLGTWPVPDLPDIFVFLDGIIPSEIGPLTLFVFVAILILLALRVPLAFASGILGAVIVYVKFGDRGLGILMQRMYGLTNDYVLISVPLFIFMAALLERSNIARDMYDALNIGLHRVRGGIAIVTAIMAIVMAAMSGIIGGEIVLLGLVALPQMLRLNYNQNLAIGTICASGSLGTLIPPSIVLIMYGLVTETSIKALFTAAIIPGLLLGGIYIIYIMIRTRMNPALAPFDEGLSARIDAMTTGERLRKILFGGVPPFLIVAAVLGSIYGGFTGITEAAAIGVIATLILIVLRREFNPTMFLQSLERTFKSAGMILWVTFGATCLAGAYSLAGGPAYVAESILALDLPPIGIILVMMGIFLILGAFMDWIGIVLLAMPVFLPIVLQLGYHPVWFGLLFTVNMQVSFLSPPFGPAAFYLKSVAPPHISLIDIFKSFLPFICMQLLVLAILLIFPGIVLLFVPG